MLTIVTAAGREIPTRFRSPKSVISAWCSGAVPVGVSEWEGCRPYRAGTLIGTIRGCGWTPA